MVNVVVGVASHGEQPDEAVGLVWNVKNNAGAHNGLEIVSGKILIVMVLNHHQQVDLVTFVHLAVLSKMKVAKGHVRHRLAGKTGGDHQAKHGAVKMLVGITGRRLVLGPVETSLPHRALRVNDHHEDLLHHLVVQGLTTVGTGVEVHRELMLQPPSTDEWQGLDWLNRTGRKEKTVGIETDLRLGTDRKLLEILAVRPLLGRMNQHQTQLLGPWVCLLRMEVL
jgi:hypothetical protein